MKPKQRKAKEPLYPCAVKGCKVMRTKAEGGTTFTVCDKHWNESYKRGEAQPATAKEKEFVVYATNSDQTMCTADALQRAKAGETSGPFETGIPGDPTWKGPAAQPLANAEFDAWWAQQDHMSEYDFASCELARRAFAAGRAASGGQPDYQRGIDAMRGHLEECLAGRIATMQMLLDWREAASASGGQRLTGRAIWEAFRDTSEDDNVPGAGDEFWDSIAKRLAAPAAPELSEEWLRSVIKPEIEAIPDPLLHNRSMVANTLIAALLRASQGGGAEQQNWSVRSSANTILRRS